MDKLKNRICLLLLVFVFPLAVLTEVVLVFNAWRKSGIERLQVEIETKTLQQLGMANPKPTIENLTAARKHHQALAAQLHILRLKLAQGVIPDRELTARFSEPQDLYFDLVKFVENYRRKALWKGISLREDENFAFGELLSQTAEFSRASAAQNYRQRLILSRLLDSLFESSPLRLAAVQRQPVPPLDGEIKSHLGNKLAGDFFTFDEPENGFGETISNSFKIRLAFTGRTENLRRFLNQIALLETPLRVCAVEVSPVNHEKTPGASIKRAGSTNSFGIFDEADPGKPARAPVPIVEENTSLFTVVLQYFEITADDESVKNHRVAVDSPNGLPPLLNPGAKSVESHFWPEPPRQSWDAEAIFEIFSPPKIYYNRQANTFVLEPPLSAAAKAEAFGLELVGFSRQPYRMQYKGFAGRAGDYHILLHNEESGADLRVRVGDVLSEEKISVIGFDVDRRLTFKPEGAPILIESVNLQLFDARLGEKITLGRGARYNPHAKAVFRTTGPSPETITLESGQSYLLREATYALDFVDIDKESVVVQKITTVSNLSERRTLLLKDVSTSADTASSKDGPLGKAMVLENFPKSIN